MAVDYLRDRLYLVGLGGGGLTVYNSTSLKFVQQIPTSGSPAEVAVDPPSGNVLVTDGANVTVYNGTTGAVIGRVSAPDAYAIVVDPSTGYAYAAISYNETVVVLNSRTGAFVGNITLPVAPYGILWPVAFADDPIDHRLYFSQGWLTYLSVIDTANNTYLGSVPLGTTADALTFDSSDDRIYALEPSTLNVTVLDGATGAIVGSVAYRTQPHEHGYPSIAFDPADGNVYFVSYGVGLLTNISTASNTIAGYRLVGRTPGVVTVDPVTGYVYIADIGSWNVSVVDGKSGTNVGSVHAPGVYPVTFSESGLPSESVWSLDWGFAAGHACGWIFQANVTSSVLSFFTWNGSYSFEAPNLDGLVASPGQGSVVVHGTNISVTIVFSAPEVLGPFGLPGLEGYILFGGPIAVLVGANFVAWTHVLRRKPR